MKKTEGYPANWEGIAYRIKEKAGWCCERCTHPHEFKSGYTLTVHHLDHDKSNNADYNLAALCQRCHLHVEPFSIFQLTHQLEIFGPYERNWLEKHNHRGGNDHDN